MYRTVYGIEGYYSDRRYSPNDSHRAHSVLGWSGYGMIGAV